MASRFGLSLRDEFMFAAPHGGASEVALFRALQAAFAHLGREYYVEEYHGARSVVRFTPTRRWRLMAGRCELSDLLIVTYQRKPVVDARFTFLQCKRDTHATAHSLRGGTRTHSGNYEQWDLLYHRPAITPIATVRPPSDVLQTATLASVGSFGIFARDGRGWWDMVYASADQLWPPSGRVARTGPLEFGIGPAVRTVGRHAETVHACCLLTFGAALEEMTVGTPLFAAPANTQAWLAGVLWTVGAHAGPGSIATELSSAISRRMERELTDFVAGDAAPNTVVIAVDDGSVARRDQGR